MKKVHLSFSALSLESVGAGLGKPDAAHEAPLAELQVSLMFQKYTPLAHSRTRTPVLASLGGRGERAEKPFLFVTAEGFSLFFLIFRKSYTP